MGCFYTILLQGQKLEIDNNDDNEPPLPYIEKIIYKKKDINTNISYIFYREYKKYNLKSIK